MNKLFTLLFKILIVGLLLHFVVYNIITFSFGRDGTIWNIIRLRKELLLGILLGLILLARYKTGGIIYIWKQLWQNIYIRFFTLGLILFTVVGVYMTTYIHELPLSSFFMAFKYDILFLIIFLIGYHAQTYIHKHPENIDTDQENVTQDKEALPKIISRFGVIMKIILWLAILRYMVIAIKPGTMKILGYNNYSYEGNIGEAAPAAYYTDINQGYTRNQFVFERPTTRGFYLIAFRPLFYLLFLHSKPKKHTRVRRCLYGLNIVVTFSRAARGAWIFEIIVMGFMLRKNKNTISHFLLKRVLPLCLILGILAFLGWEQIVSRSFSTTGHVDMLVQGRDMFMQDPLWGQGAATAGPGSHRGGNIGFNPENQFLQIMIEFGLIGFLIWGVLYASLHMLWLGKNKKDTGIHLTTHDTHKHQITPQHILFSLCVGLGGLSISGMVLHSLSDRMVIYPFMLLLGIVYARHIYSNYKT